MPTADDGNPSASAVSFTMQDAPNKSWKTGEKQPLPFGHDRMLQFDPSSLSSCYPLMISAVVPRPIALVSSLSAEGVGNLAPFSCAYANATAYCLYILLSFHWVACLPSACSFTEPKSDSHP